ncbi:MAG: DUF938 domain-containing protein [Gammaproteobacteria bacterium]
MNKPYAESAAQNRDVILEVLREAFARRASVVEIGAGTGQHAVHFAAHLPHLRWLPTDLEENLEGIRAWVDEAGLENIDEPRALDAADPDWGRRLAEENITRDAVYTANTFHIMSWPEVCACIDGCGQAVAPGGLVAVYGPFNYGGRFTSESNARFDDWLKARDPESGIRDFDALSARFADADFALERDYEMPVNNRILLWRRT